MESMVGILDHSKVRVDRVSRPPSDVIKKYQELSDTAGLVARALDQFGIHGTIPSTYLGPVRPGSTVVGPVITVRNVPQREVPYRYWERGAPTQLGEREAFFLAQPGDVVVIDGSTVYPASCLGARSAAMASQLGIAGVVVSGAITGVAGIRSVDMPVWARGGTTITGHHRVETIEINGAIGIHSVRLEPGDLVVADDSGVSVVPLVLAEEVLERVLKMKELGARLQALLEKGADRETLRAGLGQFITDLMQSSTETVE